MPPLLTIRCNQCDFRQETIPGTYRKYELADGVRINVYSRIGYCRACEEVAESENLPEVEKIEARIEGIRRGKEDEDIRYIERTRDEWAEYHERVLRWRLKRTGPPKCLQCGSVELEPINEPWNWGAKTTSEVACPACTRGVLTAQADGIVSVRFEQVSIYSPEGDFLRKEDLVFGED